MGSSKCDIVAEKIIRNALFPIPLEQIPLICQSCEEKYRLQVIAMALVASDISVLSSTILNKEEKNQIRDRMFSLITPHPWYDQICSEVQTYGYVINHFAGDDDIFVKLGLLASKKILDEVDLAVSIDTTDRFRIQMDMAKMIISTT